MKGFEIQNVWNYDETRFNPWSNSTYSFQPTYSDGSSYPRKETDEKKGITLLVGISASGQSLQPCFALKHFPRGFFNDIKSMQHKSKSFRLYINRKTDWVTSVTWTHFMKSLQEENEN